MLVLHLTSPCLTALPVIQADMASEIKRNGSIKEIESEFIISNVGVLYCNCHISYELSARWYLIIQKAQKTEFLIKNMFSITIHIVFTMAAATEDTVSSATI